MKKALLYQVIVFITHGKTLKNCITIINSKYLLQNGMMNLKYQIHHILYQIFNIILTIFKKKHQENIDNLPIRIYVNKIEN